jgi:hypothetical protein
LGLLSKEVAEHESLVALRKPTVQEPEPAPAPTPVLPAPVTPAAPAEKADPAESLQSQKKRLDDKALKLAEAEQRMKEMAERLAQGQRQLSAMQASRAQPVQDQVVDFRTAGPGVGLATAQASLALRQALGGVPQAVWEYAADEFVWPRSKSLPLGYAVADKTAGWKLIVFSDLDNPRVLRESFARGNATREWLVKDGHVRGQIQVELKPAKQVPGLGELAVRQVFMVPRP